MDFVNDVRAFNEKYGLPAPTRPQLLDRDVLEYRVKFMREELEEFIVAHQLGDLDKSLDGLVDLAYVVIGTALFMGLPFEAGWIEVQRANMQKIRAYADNPGKRGHALDVIKPEGWKAPDHRPALMACYLNRPKNVAALRTLYEMTEDEQRTLITDATGVRLDPWSLEKALIATKGVLKVDALITAIYMHAWGATI